MSCSSRPKSAAAACLYSAKRVPTVQVHLMTDPSHGWASVLVSDLAKVGLSPSDFSHCSYRRGEVCALEEDCDLRIYLDALRAHGHGIVFKEHFTSAEAPCRRWNRISPKD